MHYYADVTLEVGSKELDFEVEYDFTPEIEAKLTGPWEDSYPGEPEYFQVTSVKVVGDEKLIDVPGPLIEALEEDIEQAIREDWDE